MYRCVRILRQDIAVGPLPGLDTIELITAAGEYVNLVVYYSLGGSQKNNCWNSVVLRFTMLCGVSRDPTSEAMVALCM